MIAYGGRTSEIWWQGVTKAKVERMQNVTVWSLTDGVAAALGALAERTMRLHSRTRCRRPGVAGQRHVSDPVAIDWTVLKGKPKSAKDVVYHDGKPGRPITMSFRRPFQFDEIAFQIEEIQGRAKTFGTVSNGLLPPDARRSQANVHAKKAAESNGSTRRHR